LTPRTAVLLHTPMPEDIRALAVAIVAAEEEAKGNRVEILGDVKREKQEGCDLLVYPRDGGDPHPVEVKGGSRPFLGPRGHFLWDQDLRPSQLEAARRNRNFRIEVVANLRAHISGMGLPQRLTLTGEYILKTHYPSQYRVPLRGLRTAITEVPDAVLAVAEATVPLISE
jgi:hypothetical protein